jgi:hypothetical protein
MARGKNEEALLAMRATLRSSSACLAMGIRESRMTPTISSDKDLTAERDPVNTNPHQTLPLFSAGIVNLRQAD